MNKKINIVITLLFLILVIILVVYYFSQSKNQKKSDYIEINKESTQLNVEYSQKELTGAWESYTAKIILDDSKISIEGNGVINKSNTIVINNAGTYYLTGSISDGNIVVETTNNDEVQLVLDNVSITSKNTAPIIGIKAKKITITLAENSKNTITDSSLYTSFIDNEKTEPNATLFSKTDLVINGNGKLTIDANYSDGIASKDGLKIIDSNIEINSQDDGIRGKDYIAINNANININSIGDGIKSTNDEDETLGYISIENGTISINAEEDGIQAETVLNISGDSNIDIKTTGKVNTNNTSTSSKGLKAGKEITIENGNIQISSTDDSIHSNGIIIINEGKFDLSSGDDGIHADTNISINNGNINITKSYEGIESSYIEINGGTISVIASDDGINISGGNDFSSMGGRPGQNNFSQLQDTNKKLIINSGNIEINANGDGLDSNGSIYVNGGKIIVHGTTSGGDGALDYDIECVISGGDIIIYGATGMWQNPSNTSTQYSLTYKVSGKAGDTVVLKDSSDNIIATIDAEKSYGAITISNSNIKKGETYILYVNENSAGSLTATNVVTSNVSSGGAGMMQQHDGMMKKKK